MCVYIVSRYIYIHSLYFHFIKRVSVNLSSFTDWTVILGRIYDTSERDMIWLYKVPTRGKRVDYWLESLDRVQYYLREYYYVYGDHSRNERHRNIMLMISEERIRLTMPEHSTWQINWITGVCVLGSVYNKGTIILLTGLIFLLYFRYFFFYS